MEVASVGGSSQEGYDRAAELRSVQKTLAAQSQVATALAAQLVALCSKVELLTAPIQPDSVNRNPPCGRTAAMSYNNETTQLREICDMDEDFEDVINRDDESQKGLFADSEELKEQIRSNLREEPYHVSSLYKKSGVFQCVAKSKRFEGASLFLVVASSFWMAVDLDFNGSLLLHEADIGFQVVAHLIASLFTIELIIRFLAFKDIRNVVKDFWCMFDLLLVLFIVLETWVLTLLMEAFQVQLSNKNIRMFSVLRMLRLVRVLRLIKLFRFLPELLVIVRGIGVAIRAISLVFALLFLVIYIGAIVFRVLLEGTSFGNKHFETVTAAMGTLLLDCALSGTRGGPLMREAYGQHPIYSMLIFTFVLLTNVTMMGLLVGLLVQTIKRVAEVEEKEKESIRNEKAMEDFWKHVVNVDEDSDGYINIDEFHNLLSQPKTVRLLKKMGVDPESLVFLSNFIFDESPQGRLSQVEFNQWVLDMRSTEIGTIKDHIVTRKFVCTKLKHLFQGPFDVQRSGSLRGSLRRPKPSLKMSRTS